MVILRLDKVDLLGQSIAFRLAAVAGASCLSMVPP